ncbi:unnamed protein product [Boreogadus saida]
MTPSCCEWVNMEAGGERSCVSRLTLFPLYLRRVPRDKPGVIRRGDEMTPAGKGSRLLPEGAVVAVVIMGAQHGDWVRVITVEAEAGEVEAGEVEAGERVPLGQAGVSEVFGPRPGVPAVTFCVFPPGVSLKGVIGIFARALARIG